MLLENLEREMTTNMDGFTASQIEAENTGLAIEFFGSIYTRPEEAVLRELTANGLDAHREIDLNEPVQIQLPTIDSPYLRIIDHGLGMPGEDLIRYFANAMASTKRTNQHLIGGFGAGTKTPTAIADQYFVASVHQGVRTTMLLRKDPAGLAHKILAVEPTDDPCGTTVTVPITDTEEHDWAATARRTFYYWDPEVVRVEGLELAHMSTDIKEASSLGRVYQLIHGHAPYMLAVRLNGIAYEVPNSMSIEAYAALAHCSDELFDHPLVIDADDSPLQISKTRETIDHTKTGLTWLISTLQQWYDGLITQLFKEHFTGLTNAVDVIKIYDKLHNDSDIFNILDLKQSDVLTRLKLPTKLSIKTPLAAHIETPRIPVEHFPQEGRDIYHQPVIENEYVNSKLCNVLDNAYLITEADVTPKLKNHISAWRKYCNSLRYIHDSDYMDSTGRTRLKLTDYGKTEPDHYLIIIPEGFDNLDQLINPTQQKWVTVDQFVEMIPEEFRPSKAKRQPKAQTFQRIPYFGGKLHTPATKEQILNDLGENGLIIAGTKTQTSKIHRLIDWDNDIVISPGSRSLETLSRLLDHEIIAVDDLMPHLEQRFLDLPQIQRDMHILTHISRGSRIDHSSFGYADPSPITEDLQQYLDSVNIISNATHYRHLLQKIREFKNKENPIYQQILKQTKNRSYPHFMQLLQARPTYTIPTQLMQLIGAADLKHIAST